MLGLRIFLMQLCVSDKAVHIYPIALFHFIFYIICICVRYKFSNAHILLHFGLKLWPQSDHLTTTRLTDPTNWKGTLWVRFLLLSLIWHHCHSQQKWKWNCNTNQSFRFHNHTFSFQLKYFCFGIWFSQLWEPGRLKAITSTKRQLEHTAQSEDPRQLFVLTSPMGRPEPTARFFSYLYSVYLLISTELVSMKDFLSVCITLIVGHTRSMGRPDNFKRHT